MTVQKLCSAFVVAIAIAVPHEPILATNRSLRRPVTPPSRHATVLASQASPPPPPPDDPQPRRNQNSPGGGLDPNSRSCNSPDKSLVALVPKYEYSNDDPKYATDTTSEYPTFFFYIPDRAEDIGYGEFFINTQEEDRVGEPVRFQLPDTPGIVSVSLPQLPENALEEEQLYHWYFKLYCQEDGQPNPKPIEVSGWIRRVPATPERDRAIENASPEIWYDAIAFLARQLLAAPEDSTLRERWRELLLKILDKEGEALAEQPIVGPVMVDEESGR